MLTLKLCFPFDFVLRSFCFWILSLLERRNPFSLLEYFISAVYELYYLQIPLSELFPLVWDHLFKLLNRFLIVWFRLLQLDVIVNVFQFALLLVDDFVELFNVFALSSRFGLLAFIFYHQFNDNIEPRLNGVISLSLNKKERCALARHDIIITDSLFMRNYDYYSLKSPVKPFSTPKNQLFTSLNYQELRSLYQDNEVRSSLLRSRSEKDRQLRRDVVRYDPEHSRQRLL